MDVIVENRQTGEKKQMTSLMANNLSLRYRIIGRVGEADLSKGNTFTPPDNSTPIDKLRLKYFEKFGQQPHHRLGEKKLQELINE